MDHLPRLAGGSVGSPELLDGIAGIKSELERVGTTFRDEAVRALREALVARGVADGFGGLPSCPAVRDDDRATGCVVPSATKINNADSHPPAVAFTSCASANARDHAAAWAACFPESFVAHLADRVAKGVLTLLAKPHDDDGALANALSTLLLGLPLHQWNDASPSSFRRQLHSVLETIEGAAFDLARRRGPDSEIRSGLAKLADARTRQLASRLAELLGREEAARTLEAVAARLHASAGVTAGRP